MWAAIASTGAALRWASNSPLIRCKFPGPQLPAHTAKLPVSWASAPAAKAAASSWRTSTHLSVLRRRASVTGLRLSPTTP